MLGDFFTCNADRLLLERLAFELKNFALKSLNPA